MNRAKSQMCLQGRKRLALFLVLILASLAATGFAWTYKKVSVVADGMSVTVRTMGNQVEDVLKEANISLNHGDEVVQSTPRLINGTILEVRRAIPLVISYQGQDMTVWSAKPTVGEVAEQTGLLRPDLDFSPGKAEPVTPGMIIKALQVKEEQVEEVIATEIPVVRQSDPNLEKGHEEVLSEGSEGLKKIVKVNRYVEGQLTGNRTVSELDLVSATPKIIRVGARDTVQTSRGSMRFTRAQYMEATAYLPTDGSATGITATGIQARHGVVAVDPRIIPLGTRLYIPGYGLALAADTGGDIKGNRIDLCMERPRDAWNFGRQTVKVYILAEP